MPLTFPHLRARIAAAAAGARTLWPRLTGWVRRNILDRFEQS